MTKNVSVQNYLASIMATQAIIANADVAAALKQQEEARAKAGAEIALGVLQTVAATVTSNVKLLREVRAKERKLKSTIESMNRAAAYFVSTGQALPLLRLQDKNTIHGNSVKTYCDRMGISVPEDNDPIYEVPANFKFDAPAVPE